jgi:hypothetical protein
MIDSRISGFLFSILVKKFSLLGLAIVLTSCAEPLVNPAYATHASNTLTNPGPDAILGTWYTYHDAGGGLGGTVNTKLVLPDGLAYSRVKFQGTMASAVPEKVRQLHDTNIEERWAYESGGLWVFSGTDVNGGRYAQRARTDGKVLLTEHMAGSRPVRQIWVRAENEAAVARERQGSH